MKRIDVCNLLNAGMSPEDFCLEYLKEINEYARSRQRQGGVTRIYLFGDEPIYVDEKGIERIMKYVEEGRINKLLVAYVLDALSLDEGVVFSSQGLREKVLDLSDS